MSVHSRKLPSGRTSHEVRWREGSSNKSRAFDDPKAAREFDKEMRRLRQAGEFALELDHRRVTVADLIEDWWERSAPGLSDKTVDNYALQIKLRVRPTFANRRVRQLKVADVEKWISAMRKAGTGDPTIIKACTVLQALLSMAVRDGIVAVNVAQQARKPNQGRTRIPYLVKPEAVEAIRSHLHPDSRDVLLLDLLAYAGLRPESEAVVLRWRQVRDRSLVIRDTKRARERTVTLLEPLAEMLDYWRVRMRPASSDLVVPSADGDAWTEADWRNWRRRVFRPAAVAAGLPTDVRPRDLRGSFVSLLVHEGRSIVEVARQVGHSPVICLRDYAQVFDDAKPGERQDAAAVIREARFALSSHGPDGEGTEETPDAR